MAGGSVRSTGGYLKVTPAISLASAAHTVIFEAFFNSNQPNGLFNQLGPDLYVNGGNTKFQVYRNPPDDADPNSVWLFYRNSSGVGQDLRLGDDSTMKGKWVHFAWCVDAADAAHFYVLIEGFNPASPSYVVTPSLGTTQSGSNRASMWIQGTNDSGISQQIRQARLILCAAKLTEAQVLAQFAQRNPTSAVTAVSYTWLKCEDAANVEVDAGSTATNWTKTSTLTDEVDEPFEWIGTPAVWRASFDMPVRPRTLPVACYAPSGSFGPVSPPSAPSVAPTIGYASQTEVVRPRERRPEGGASTPIALGQLAVPAVPQTLQFPTAVRGSKPNVSEGWSVSVPQLPQLPAPPLPVANFPSFITRAKRLMNEDDGSAPVIPPPIQVDWSDFIFASESWDTEVVLHNWAAYNDRAAALRRMGGMTGSQPTLVSAAPAAPTMSWSPEFPDDTRLPRRPVWEGVSVSVPQLPQFTPPALSWAAEFPDTVLGPRRPVREGFSALPLGLPSFPVPALAWAGEFPDSVPGPKRPVAEGMVAWVPGLASIPVPALAWSGEFPDMVPGPRRPVQEGFSVAVPWLGAMPVPALSWAAEFVDVVPRGRPPLVPTGFLAFAPFPLPNASAPPGWQGSFPDRIFLPPRAIAEGWSVSVLQVAQLPAPSIGALVPAYPERVPGVRRPVQEGWSTSEPFIAQLPVPPLGWAPEFADFVPGPRQPVREGVSVGPVLPIAPVVVPPLSFASAFPDAVRGVPRPVAEGWSASVPWLAVLPPAPLAAQPSFPDRVWGAARPVAEGFSAGVPWVVSLPVPGMGWTPAFPDQARGPKRAINEGGAFGPPQLTALPVPGLGWMPRFPDWIAVAKRCVELGFSQRSPLPIIIIPAPDLSWQGHFPDYIVRPVYVIPEARIMVFAPTAIFDTSGSLIVTGSGRTMVVILSGGRSGFTLG